VVSKKQILSRLAELSPAAGAQTKPS
jgi:hypothetical protein